MKNIKREIYVKIESRNDDVTPSCNIATVIFPNNTTRSFMVDCGISQGESDEKAKNLFYDSKMLDVDFSIITHNHIDHTGKFPYIVSKGFNKKIYTTHNTKKLMSTGLYNSAAIYEREITNKNEKPYFSSKDVESTLSLIETCYFNNSLQIDSNFRITFFENAHMLGAAYVIVQVSYPGCATKNLFFTGDYKEENKLFKVSKFPKWLYKLKLYMICESTYGISEEKESPHFINDVAKFLEEKKTVFIASIAQERLERILFELKLAQDSGILSKDYSINIDTTLGIQYLSDYRKILGDFFLPKNLHFWNKKNRQQLLFNNSPKIIIASSGMGDKGVSPLYINNFIGDGSKAIYFTSYLAPTTLGYSLVNSDIYSNIYSTTEFSGHARFSEFIKIFAGLKIIGIFFNHGTANSKLESANKAFETLNINFAKVLDSKTSYLLANDTIFNLKNNIINLYNNEFLNDKKHNRGRAKTIQKYKNNTKKKRFYKSLNYC